MIPLIDDYLSDLLENKLAYLKSNPDYLYKILATSQVKLDRLKAYIQNRPIKVIKGYPRTPAELPCVCILLSNENEEQLGLGDYIDDDVVTSLQTTETLQVIDVPGGRLAVPYVELTNKPVASISSIYSHQLGITLDPSEYLLDNPDLGLVGFYTGNIEDGDSLDVTYIYNSSSASATEVKYDANFRIESWSDNGDLTVEIYNLTKWALLSGRVDLINQGLFMQKLSGTDFDPAPEFFPAFVYRRALGFWGHYAASVPNDTYEYITDVSITQTVIIDTGGGK